MFNKKIDDSLKDIANDPVGYTVLKDYIELLPKDAYSEIKKSCQENYFDFNYTFCSDNNEDLYEFNLYNRIGITDMIIAKHIPAYDEHNNYIGRNLSYLLRVSIEKNNITSIIYFKDKDKTYTKNYKTQIIEQYKKTLNK